MKGQFYISKYLLILLFVGSILSSFAFSYEQQEQIDLIRSSTNHSSLEIKKVKGSFLIHTSNETIIQLQKTEPFSPKDNSRFHSDTFLFDFEIDNKNHLNSFERNYIIQNRLRLTLFPYHIFW
jgi:hypothetical protein